MSSLDDWSRIIKRQGEEHSHRRDEELKELKSSTELLLPQALQHEQLIETFAKVVQGCTDYRPKFAEQFKIAREKLKTEILRRIESKGA
jgi:hypothetical protein